ncbi:MAG: ABC transporter [Rhodobacteraceae bacterium]|nr:ABC transporter [Paracoccaceae bacterium]
MGEGHDRRAARRRSGDPWAAGADLSRQLDREWRAAARGTAVFDARHRPALQARERRGYAVPGGAGGLGRFRADGCGAGQAGHVHAGRRDQPVSEPLLCLRDVGHAFDGVPALKDLSFDLAAGERLAVLGPSGCGKTTLLRLVAGLLPVQAGRITLDGVPPVAGRGSAMIFQTARLLPWYRVAENIELVLGRMPRADRRARAVELLDRLGLGDRPDDWPGALSGGQRQRLALARALAMEEPLLLLDEPFANLDPLAREQMQEELLAQTGREGRAFVLVTHSVDEALALGDRILLMRPRPGRVLREIRPDLPGIGMARRRNGGFYPALAALTEELRAAAA